MNETLLCKDCAHSFKPLSAVIFFYGAWSLRCRASFKPAEIKEDLVSGPRTVPAHYESCGTARLGFTSKDLKDTNCGKDARHWQPRNKRDLFKLIAKEHHGT